MAQNYFDEIYIQMDYFYYILISKFFLGLLYVAYFVPRVLMVICLKLIECHEVVNNIHVHFGKCAVLSLLAF